MKSFKLYLLSLLTLISAAPMGAMQAPKQIQSGSVAQVSLDTINIIENEVNAIVGQIANSLRKVIAGQAKDVNVIYVDTLKEYTAFNLPLNSFKETLIKFLDKVKQLDRASEKISRKDIIKLAISVNDLYKNIKVQIIQQIREINDLAKCDVKNAKPTVSIKPSGSNEQLLNQLSQALRADVEKMVNFDLHTQKVPGALQLTKALLPFVAHLTGDLAELQAPFNTYIQIAAEFDNAQDTELMELVSQAVENLSNKIAQLRKKLTTHVCIAAKQKPKRKVTFAEVKQESAPQITLVKEPVSVKEQPASQKTSFLVKDRPHVAKHLPSKQNNVAAPIAPVKQADIVENDTQLPTQAPTVQKPVVTAVEPNAIAQPKQSVQSLVNSFENQKTSAIKPNINQPVKQLSPIKEQKNTLIDNSIMAAPVLIPVTAGVIATAAPKISAIAQKLNMDTVSQASKTFANQLAAFGNAIGRNLGNLGTFPKFNLFALSPSQAALLGLPPLAGAGIYYLTRPGQTARNVQQLPIVHADQKLPSGVSIQELDPQGNIIPASNIERKKETRKARSNNNNNALITPGRIATAATAGLSLGALGYAAYNYLPQLINGSIAPAFAVPGQHVLNMPGMLPSAMQANLLSSAATAATPIISAATNAATNVVKPMLSQAGTIAGQAIPQWLASNATNLFV
jgi:hypothetical protein